MVQNSVSLLIPSASRRAIHFAHQRQHGIGEPDEPLLVALAVVDHKPAAHLPRELDVVVGQVEGLVDAQRTRVDGSDQRRVSDI
jgi:hypothetical protein